MRFLSACMSLIALPCIAATQPPIEMVIGCQQSLSDGRILVDGRMLPVDARYVVRQYRPQRSEGGWSHGECRIAITKGASG